MDWRIPRPRPGWRGAVDRFFGPGQTHAEILAHLTLMPPVLIGIAWMAWPVVDTLAWWAVLVLAIVAIDGVGGVVTNSTGTAKRWYHRPRTRPERLRFVALHAIHLTLLAGVVLHSAWTWLMLNIAFLAGATVLVEFTPLSVKRAVATAMLILAVAINGALAPLPDGLEWLTLLLYTKLLVAHLVPEAPFRDPVPA